MACWLERLDVPLMVSRQRLCDRRRMPRARLPWVLDSGGFNEVTNFGGWRIDAKTFVSQVCRIAEEVGQMLWSPPQDWMCEEKALLSTGLSIREHQRRTLVSFLECRDLAPEIPWIPVLQGATRDDYLRHVDDYLDAGVDLSGLPTVGLGSVCRRQATDEVVRIVADLHRLGLSLHGFGVKLKAKDRLGPLLQSADSLAWSLHARKRAALPGCTHRNCSSCARYALLYRERVIAPPLYPRLVL
jgi:hypothetical protein